MTDDVKKFVLAYAEGRDSQDAVSSLAYLCRMLWMCRSDKLRQDEIPFLVDITNIALQASEEYAHLEPLPRDERAYRMGHNEVYFADVGHKPIEQKVIKVLREILMPPAPKRKAMFSWPWLKKQNLF